MKSEDETARRIDLIREKVAPLVMHEPLFETAMALTLLAAHSVVHDGASEDEFLAMARAAYRRSLEVHRAGRGSKEDA